MGGAVAEVATVSVSTDRSEALLSRSTALSAVAAAEALAVRRQETVERSTQRERLADVGAAAEQARADQAAAQALADAQALAAAQAAAAAPPPPSWVLPLSGYHVSSLFGPRWGGRHNGLDLAVDSGTPIRAMGAGEIVEAGWSGGYGQRTIIRHADGTETWYCHQSRLELTGGSVAAGDVIGYVGSTGNSTGPHLHLEVHPAGGDPIDPVGWLTGLGLTL